MTATRTATTDQDQSPQQVVENFFAACCALDFDGALNLIDDQCVYKNMPFHTARGKARIERDLSLMARGMTSFEVEMVNIAVNGPVVLTERIDTLAGRFFKAELHLMGVLVVKNGKITEWRDYFDWSAMMGKFTGSLLRSPFRR
jgi:limonene-1,2-epoxide hydrolase